MNIIVQNKYNTRESHIIIPILQVDTTKVSYRFHLLKISTLYYKIGNDLINNQIAYNLPTKIAQLNNLLLDRNANQKKIKIFQTMKILNYIMYYSSCTYYKQTDTFLLFSRLKVLSRNTNECNQSVSQMTKLSLIMFNFIIDADVGYKIKL